jgi:hypothetical protein
LAQKLASKPNSSFFDSGIAKSISDGIVTISNLQLKSVWIRFICSKNTSMKGSRQKLGYTILKTFEN